MLTTGDQSLWIKNWRASNGGHFRRPHAHALKALEEMIELCFASGATPLEIQQVMYAEVEKAKDKGENTGKFDAAHVAEELADTSLCLNVLALEAGIFVPDAVSAKIQVLESRKWRPDEDGVLRRPR